MPVCTGVRSRIAGNALYRGFRGLSDWKSDASTTVLAFIAEQTSEGFSNVSEEIADFLGRNFDGFVGELDVS